MKRLVVMIMLIVFGTAFYGQVSDVPFKRCNTIKVVPRGEKDNMMEQFAEFIEKEGYDIRRLNGKNTNLRTVPFNLYSQVQTNAVIHVMAPRKETKKNYLTITSFAKPNEYGKSHYKMKGLAPKYTIGGLLFEKVNELAIKFASTYNYKLVYLKKKH